MSALKTPAPDAPAEEWGAFAVSIPDWRWPDSCPLPGFYRKSPDDAAWKRVPCIETLAWGGGECVPDPDHWAWEGWLLRLLESADPRPYRRPGGLWVVATGPGVAFEPDRLQPRTLGRAAIAAAAANGRWPGGDQ